MLWLSLLVQLRAMQARGGRNPFVNGAMAVAQRGTSAALAVAPAIVSVDRWWARQAGVANALAQRVASGSGFSYALRVARNAGGAELGAITTAQAIESIDCTRFQGKVCTFSFYAKKGANFSGAAFGAQLAAGTGTDETGSTLITAGFAGQTLPANANPVLTVALQRFAYVVAIPANATQLGALFGFTPTGVAGADDSFTVTGVMLNEGPAAAPYDARDYSEELVRCQRHLPAFNAATVLDHVCPGQAVSGTLAYLDFPFAIEPRAIPTGAQVSAVGHFSMMDAAAAAIVCTGIAHSARTSRKTGVLGTSVAAGLVAGNATRLIATNATAQLLFTGAEL